MVEAGGVEPFLQYVKSKTYKGLGKEMAKRGPCTKSDIHLIECPLRVSSNRRLLIVVYSFEAPDFLSITVCNLENPWTFD